MPRRSKRERLAAGLDARPVRHLHGLVPSWPGVLVLNYHRVGRSEASPWDHTLWSATPEQLDAQLACLVRDAEVVGPEDLAPGAFEGHGRRVLVTFDDGYRDNFELALPILRSHGVRGLFFLATEFLDRSTVVWWDEIAWMLHTADPGRSVPAGAGLPGPVHRFPGDAESAAQCLIRRYKELPGHATNAYLDHLGEALGTGRCTEDPDHWMTWEMAREMQSAGMGIGGHTVTHPMLARLPVEEQRAEIHGCAERLRQELGGPMRWFSYPVGSRDSFSPATERLVEAEDVELAFSFYGGTGRLAPERAFDVRRVDIGAHITPPLLRATLALPRLFARES